MDDTDYYDKINKDISSLVQLELKPKDVRISTMTVICKVPLKFMCINIAKYINLNSNGILSVKYGNKNNLLIGRSMITVKKKNKPKVKNVVKTGRQKKQNTFQNQVTLYVKVKTKEKPINIKVCSNGSLQMTGCISVIDALEALKTIFDEFKSIKAVFNKETNTIDEIQYVSEIAKLNFKYVFDFNIAMIQSNFKVPFEIDRIKLYELMRNEQYNCTFEPIKHACVNISYDPNKSGKSVSIFVFEKGSILITGVSNCKQIYDGYIFINKYLLSNITKIIKQNRTIVPPPQPVQQQNQTNINKYLK